ncbi:MAG: hypothetical protein V1835_05075 [Candidatus Micrarchaeota archaeon]
MIQLDKKYVLLAALVISLVLANFVASAIFITDSTGISVPDENGTSDMLNITARMQQYVGFYGNINTTVRLSTAVGNNMYSKPVTEGKIYFYKNGATPTGAVVAAANDSETDANFSLSGYYITGNHYQVAASICGVADTPSLNTTDNYAVGILRDEAYNFFLCTDIAVKTSSHGMGTPSFEIVVPKTSTYASYDVYIDLE